MRLPTRTPFLMVALSVVLVVLSACGGTAAAPTAAPTKAATAAPAAATATTAPAKPTAAATTAAATPAAAAPTAAPASTTPIKLGAILALTGPQSSIGNQFKIGYDLAVEDINAAGGILGRKVELVVKDDQAAADKTVLLTKEALFVDKVDAFLNYNGDAPFGAGAPLAMDEKKLVMQGGITDARIGDPKHPYAFSFAAPRAVGAAKAADYLFKKIGGKGTSKIGVLADNGAYGKGYTDAFVAALKELGAAPLDIQYFATTDLDLSTPLKVLKSKGAEAVVMYSYGPPVARVLTNLTDMGWTVPVLGAAGFVTSDWNELGKQALAKNFMMTTYAYSLTGPDGKPTQKAQDFVKRAAVKAVAANFTGDLVPATQYYDTVFAVKWAAEKAGSIEGPKVSAALETMKDWSGPLTGPYTLTATNHFGVGLSGVAVVNMVPLVEKYWRNRAPNSD